MNGEFRPYIDICNAIHKKMLKPLKILGKRLVTIFVPLRLRTVTLYTYLLRYTTVTRRNNTVTQGGTKQGLETIGLYIQS